MLKFSTILPYIFPQSICNLYLNYYFYSKSQVIQNLYNLFSSPYDDIIVNFMINVSFIQIKILRNLLL